jgi:hypothetical protein
VLQNLCTYFLCVINTLNAELNLICHLLALLGAHHILHISRIRVNTACIEPRICNTHGLHLNSQGKKKLTSLTAKQVSCGYVWQAWAVFLLWFMQQPHLFLLWLSYNLYLIKHTHTHTFSIHITFMCSL